MLLAKEKIKSRFQKLAGFGLFSFGCLLLLTQSGCAVHLLTDKATFVPACPDGFAAFAPSGSTDVLVAYREKAAGWDRSRPRGYYLFANVEKVAAYHSPKFIRKLPAGELKPIPVFSALSENGLTTNGYWMVKTTNSYDFVLYQDARCAGHFKLPTYETYSPRRHLALVPVAVDKDAAVTALELAAYLGQAVEPLLESHRK